MKMTDQEKEESYRRGLLSIQNKPNVTKYLNRMDDDEYETRRNGRPSSYGPGYGNTKEQEAKAKARAVDNIKDKGKKKKKK